MSDSQDAMKKLATTPPRITILSDGPISDKEIMGDLLHLETKLSPLYDILRHGQTQTPMAAALYGDWGTGKTSAMRWLHGLLLEWNELPKDKMEGGVKVRPVWFYPWKYQNKEDVWRGLVAEVIMASINVEDATPGRIREAAK